ncbi:MAG: 2-C-methyl-D-erythritol 4-phosphate cytidylyltransferase [Porticoccaceae bacterium]|nr:MAG: 2-C-methyl-D-erythritol 4-phosphate cytidylyltransferase [Porticoccaceae bacterium]
MRLHVVVPAAGRGRRLGGALPKQYLPLGGRPVLDHVLARLLALDPVQLVVALAPGDERFATLAAARDPRVRSVTGGGERAESVARALAALEGVAADDWVLVHDAARPCLDPADAKRLLAAVADSPVGGLLACPVSDTLKVDDGRGRSARTLDREGLWAAQTPQVFRHQVLRRALAVCRERGIAPTDEAMAVEQLGLAPILVPGRRDNLKITVPEDLRLAEALLAGGRG